MDGLTGFYGQWQGLASLPDARDGEAARHGVDPHPGSASGYEPPRITVIGNVRDLTGGSASSGKSDANSQYYW
jgi:hypothetical protein